MKRSKFLLLALALGVIACEPYEAPQNEFEKKAAATATAGSLNLTKYVAVGNSLTAGFADNALYREAQINSYPAIMARQFAEAGGGPFNQMLLPDGFGFGGFVGTPPAHTAVLGRLFVTIGGAPPAITNPAPRTTMPGSIFDPILNMSWRPASGQTENQNWGVPGVTIASAQSTALSNSAAIGGSPFFHRIARTVGGSTVIGDAAASSPTFWTFWLGNNDALGYATAGGAVPLTASGAFATSYNAGLAQMTAIAGSRGLVANIPDVTSIAFFNAIGSRTFPPAPAATLTTAQVPGINLLWAAYLTQLSIDATPVGGLPPGATATGHTNPTFVAGVRTNGVMFVSSTGGIRMTNARNEIANTGDLICLTASTPLATGAGIQAPLVPVAPGSPGDIFGSLAASVQTLLSGAGITGVVYNSAFRPLGTQFVLDQGEITTARTAVADFNTTIAAAVTAANAGGTRVALWDANTFFRTVATSGIRVGDARNQQLLTVAFLTGGLFSLDGVHPTQAGSAIIANEMIKTLNSTFGSTIKTVDPTDYRTIRIE